MPTMVAIAKRLGVTPANLTSMCTGNRIVGLGMAKRLAAYTGHSPWSDFCSMSGPKIREKLLAVPLPAETE